jgi:hypothetical protein
VSSTRLLDAVAFNETLAKLSTAYWRTLIVAPISDRPELTAAIAASNAAMDVLEAAEVSISEDAMPFNSPEPAVIANVFDPKAELEDVNVMVPAVAVTVVPIPDIVPKAVLMEVAILPRSVAVVLPARSTAVTV